MRILIVGGTRFIGRHLTEAALAGGHDVTLLHRGRTGGDLYPEATHLLADRDGDLSVLAGGTWDATVDVSGYFPRQVDDLADAIDIPECCSARPVPPPPAPALRGRRRAAARYGCRRRRARRGAGRPR
jgi:nucleoside-diphosphate-sugar epimerase